MEVIDDAGRKYRGKMGNLIYYTVNGKTYVRRARKRPGRQGKPRTEKQKALSGRFRLVQKVYSFYMQTVSADIWRIAARSWAGYLVRPGGLLVEGVGGGRFRATWTDERELARTAASDRLKVGVFYPSTPTGLYWAEEMSGTRGDGCGEFRLDTQSDTEAHVYLFFAREDGGAYTPSMHFHVAMDKE